MKVYSNIPEFLKRLQGLRESVAASSSNNGGGGTIATDISDAMFGALSSGAGLMKRRIFNNSEDAEGNSLGKYTGKKSKLTKEKYSGTKYSIQGLSVGIDQDAEKERKKQRKNSKVSIGEDLTEYEKYRLSRGRQIEKKDLEVDGVLRRSIETVKSEGKVIIAFTNEEEANIGRYQEQQIANIRAGQNANTGTAEPARIFVLSSSEYDIVKEQGNRLIKDVIQQKFKEL